MIQFLFIILKILFYYIFYLIDNDGSVNDVESLYNLKKSK